MIDSVWIKNAGQGSRDHPHPVPIPISLNQYIRFYLDTIRPLLEEGAENFFWVNTQGKPLSSTSCRKYIKDFLQQTCQKDMTIRLLRLNINSHFHDSGPHDPQQQLWWNYLMDHSPETERDYYRVWDTEKWSHAAAQDPHPFMVFLFSLLLTHLLF